MDYRESPLRSNSRSTTLSFRSPVLLTDADGQRAASAVKRSAWRAMVRAPQDHKRHPMEAEDGRLVGICFPLLPLTYCNDIEPLSLIFWHASLGGVHHLCGWAL